MSATVRRSGCAWSSIDSKLANRSLKASWTEIARLVFPNNISPGKRRRVRECGRAQSARDSEAAVHELNPTSNAEQATNFIMTIEKQLRPNTGLSIWTDEVI
jgi:hypothetical protein